MLDRVATTELDTTSTGRLAFRLKKRFAMDMSPQELLEAPGAVIARSPRSAPHVWPTGPAPGVYITTSQHAIDALLDVYEDATDGAVVYAERAGNGWGGSIATWASTAYGHAGLKSRWSGIPMSPLGWISSRGTTPPSASKWPATTPSTQGIASPFFSIHRPRTPSTRTCGCWSRHARTTQTRKRR